jgi:hypothetical protein
MKDPYTHHSSRVRYKPSSHLRGKNQAFLCSALYSWSLNLAKHHLGIKTIVQVILVGKILFVREQRKAFTSANFHEPRFFMKYISYKIYKLLLLMIFF